MTMLSTRQQATRSGLARRLTDPVAQQRALDLMGLQISLDVLRGLPPGGWVRLVPEGRPLRLGTRPRR